MAKKSGPNKLTESRLSIFKESALPSPKKPTIFEKPMSLIINVNGQTTCDLNTLAELSKIEKTLNVVSVVGSLRTGKSFLLNKLANTRAGEGFETGHSVKAVTKGIWIMCRPHPTQKDQVLVLLDTEGIDDPDKAPDKFLREIKSSISVTGADTDDSILDVFFPTFVLTLRDFTLSIEERTPDVFLEGKLMLQYGHTDNIKKYNEPRQLIRRYFKERRCFIFRKPVKQKFLSQLMLLPERDLKPEFQQTLNSFREYIFSCEPKTLKSGRGINGRMLATLLTSYVASIQEGKAPCLQRAMKTMSDVENKHAVDKAAEVYNAEMKRRISEYNTPTDARLLNFHKDSMKAALDVMKSAIVLDDEQFYEEEALVMFKTHLGKFKTVIDKNSKALCRKRLDNLNLMIKKKMNNRTYCHPAGYDEYMEDIQWLIKQFSKDASYLGTKAKDALQEFLDSKEAEEEEVYQMVLEAQKGTQEKPRPRVQRLNSLVDVDTEAEKQRNETRITEEKKIENEISRDITALQIDGIRSIGIQYFKMLNMKIAELDRVKSELSEDNPCYKKLQQETEYWKKLLENATWSLPQYKDYYFQPVSETKNGKETRFSKSDLSGTVDQKDAKDDTKTKEREQTAAEKSMPVYDEDFFRVKSNPVPTDPNSIDAKFIVMLNAKEAKQDKQNHGNNPCKIL